jgi:hypothetical protein
MKKLENDPKYKFEPLVEVLKYSQVKHGDVLILRCERGQENEEIKKMNSALKTLLIEKDLRILAVTPDLDMNSISISIEAAKNFKEEYVSEE